MNCLNCKKETTNPKFCCRSCANSYNNRLYPKRKAKLKPEKPVGSNEKSQLFKELTLNDYHNRESVKNKHVSWKNSHIRGLNRSWNKHMRLLSCAKCGYDKHVELCHIKPVSSFPSDALLKDINAESNVIQLCPNCHWELDNGLLVINK